MRHPAARRVRGPLAGRAALLDDVGDLVGDERVAVVSAGLVLAGREEDVAADRERACRDGAREGVRMRLAGVHAHVAERLAVGRLELP